MTAPNATTPPPRRNPTVSLDGCDRILIVGRTGSGKTTLGRALAAHMGVGHIELDSLLFDQDLRKVPVEVLRERTADALSGERWVSDGNKRALRDITWPRGDTLVWLDYPMVVSLWRLAKRARKRTASTLKAGTKASSAAGSSDARRSMLALPMQLLRAANGVLTALRSHRGQRKLYPVLFAQPQHRHLEVVRLRSPRATKRWLELVTRR